MRPPEATAPDRSQEMPARQVAVAIGLGLILIVLTAVAIRFTEMVHGQYISTAVPPLPAFAALLALSVLRPLLQRHAPRLAPTRAQILLIYAMMTVAVILSGLYHIRAFLPHLVALQYWGPKESLLAGYARYLPGWYAPHNAKAIQDYYEGTRSGSIPWGVWLVPLFFWSLFFIALFIGIFSMVNLVQRQWIRNEKVSFPLLTIPLALTANDWSSFGPRKSRRALFLAGFAVAAVFSAVNILHALYPSVPAPGFQIPLIPTTLNRPWTPLQAIEIYFMLETIGIGYFVPLEVSFSAWFFYALDRMFAVAGTAAGYDSPGFPFTGDQCAGGYIAIGLLLLLGLRRPLTESLRRSFRGKTHGSEEGTERWAWIGLAASSTFILGFCYMAGLSLKLAVPYFLVVGLFVLVYARIRAETGAPFQIIYPLGGSKDLLLNTIGVPSAVSSGGVRAFTLLYSLAWLSTHHHPQEQAAYQMDSLKLAEEGRISRRTLFIALLLAFVIGLGTAYWVHLSTYYKEGSNLIPSAGEIGEWREKVAHQQYQEMATRLADMPPRSMSRLVATAGGFGFAAALALLRQRWIGCPFHPLGYLLATASGDTSTNWFPMLIAWACKFTILRMGGLRLYRQGMPFFLGLAIGHLLIAGIIWPVITLTLTKEAANSYHLLFGE